MKNNLDNFHISCLPKSISLKALQTLKAWQYASEHQPNFYLKSSGRSSEYDNIIADDITEVEAKVATALCFGFYFGSNI